MPRDTLDRRLRRLVEELVVGGVTLEQARREFERQYVIAALLQHEGSFGRSAKALGIHRNTLRNRMATLRIERADFDAVRR